MGKSSYYTRTSTRSSKKRTLKSCEYPEMEKQLYKWFIAQREKNLSISSDILKQKAIRIFGSLYSSAIKFNASDGWLQRFKARHGIRFLKITGEKLSSQPELVGPFKEQLKKVIDDLGLTENQLFNADETALYWKLLPDKTYVSTAEKTAPGMKIAKQRVTFLGCASAARFKLKSLVIGKAKNPRCFKNFRNPVIYKSTKKAWMTATVYKDWFFYHFVPEVKQYLKGQHLPLKAVLLLDNAPSHPPANELKTDDGNIFVMFMPPNVTPIIEPMDQNALRLTKLFYRKTLLTSIVASNENVVDSLKNLTFKDAMLHLYSDWDKITPRILSKCWYPILSKTVEYTDEDCIPLSELRKIWKDEEVDQVVAETMNLLQEVQEANYTKNDIAQWNQDDVQIIDMDDEDNISSEEDDCSVVEESRPKIKHNEAIEALKLSMQWAQENSFDIDGILCVKKLYEKAVAMAVLGKKKPLKITSFFK